MTRFVATALGVFAGLAGLLALGDAGKNAGTCEPVRDEGPSVDATAAPESASTVAATSEAAEEVFFGPDAATPHPTAPRARVSRAQQAEAAARHAPVAFQNSLGMRFVLIPSGTFTVGSPKGEPGHGENDPEHEPLPHVETLREPYYLALTEVTNAQFRRFRPGHRSGESWGRSLDADAQPVVNVSHDDAEAFVAWLTAHDGGGAYRLPSEVEWERAARAGTRTAYWWGASSADAARHANLADASAARGFSCAWGVAEDDGFTVTAPVASYDANPFGLYDILGNVFEWCAADGGEVAASGRASSGAAFCVARGGSWNECPNGCRVAHRLQGPGSAGARMTTIGFRVALSIPGMRSAPTRNE